ncbi:hypothetical protein LCGC14_2543350, partial [marine sediment metagenome]
VMPYNSTGPNNVERFLSLTGINFNEVLRIKILVVG